MVELHEPLLINFQGLESAVKTACKELGDEFTDNIYDKYGK